MEEEYYKLELEFLNKEVKPLIVSDDDDIFISTYNKSGDVWFGNRKYTIGEVQCCFFLDDIKNNLGPFLYKDSRFHFVGMVYVDLVNKMWIKFLREKRLSKILKF